MLNNLANNNIGNATKSVVERKHYEAIEDRLDELQGEIESNTEAINQNAQDISGLDDRVDAVENKSTFPTLNTDVINPATGDKVEVTSGLEVDGEVEASFANFGELSVNGTSFTTVKNDAAQAKSTAEIAENKANDAYSLADALSSELATYKADNEQSITTGTLNADSVVTDSISAQTINTNDFETTNAEIDKLYVDTIKATGFLELPTTGQSYYTITIPAKTTASFSGVYTSDNNTDYPFYFTVSDGAVIYKQGSTEIIKDISFDRETGSTKVRVKSSTNLTYISTALDNNPATIEDGGNAYTDYAFIPQKTGGYLIRGYDDTTTEIYIAGVLKAYAMSIEEEIIERTSVDFLKVNASIELPKEWDAGGTISYSTGEENQYISAQTKAGVTKPTWTSPIHSTIGSLSYSSKLVDEATVASYNGISETRQTQTISITNEASLQQLTAFHWTKNGTYWQPYETTRITIGDQTMWIDPTEANQGIRFIDNQVIADGTWEDVPVEEANAVPVNLVIFDAPTELSFPITNLGDKTTVHGEITATCFKGDVLGNVTGNADTATNATCFDNKTYAEAKTDILSGCAADSNKFNGKTYSEACADILSGNAASATNATCFDGKTYAEAKADILSGCAANANDATCFNGKTYSETKTDILSGNAASATNATCFNSKTYSEAKADILSGTAAQAHCVDIDSLTTNSYPLVMESTTCELGKSGTCPITFTPSTGILETKQVSTSCIENSGTTKSQYLCATCDINVDGNAYITGDLTVQGTITTTHSEEVVTPSENIILRDGATTPIASGCYSGFTVTNYDGQNNNLEVGADKDGTLHVGVVGETMEPIATRATEACMENGYAAHWDSTGTDLVTKGATNTHNLTVNGNASVTGDLSVTGTLTADLTGTADNATKFDGKTYSEAKADILSGCAADSAKLGNKDASCYIDNSSTAQTKAGNLSIGAPAACTSTSAGAYGVAIIGEHGDIEAYGASPTICFHNMKYCGDCSSSIASCYNTTTNHGDFIVTINDGHGCTPYTEGTLYHFTSDGTFSGATNICGTNIYQNRNKVIDSSSTAQTKAGHLCIGTPAGTTSTTAGSSGTIITNYGLHELYSNFPRIDFHHCCYCGDYSTRLIGTTNGRFQIIQNNGTGCTEANCTGTFTFDSNGTFTDVSTICASCNIYSAGCPVVTTGTLPTVAPGYNCTGTSNYVVTTMVCCAKSVCRQEAYASGSWHLALFDNNTSCASAGAYVSATCPLTYNPATGVLNVQKVCQCVDSYHAQLPSPNNTTRYITLKLGNANGYAEFTSTVDIDVFNNHIHANVKVSSGVVTINEISRTVDYGIRQYLLGEYDETNKTITLYFTFTNYREASITSSTPIVEASVSATAPTGTFTDIPWADRTNYVGLSSANAEYPLVFSTCCATPASGFATLYNDSANNLMYNPSTNTLTTTYVRGSCRVIVGCPTGCTSTQAGAGGAVLGGGICLYHSTPFLDFHHNNACAAFSHRLWAQNGYFQLIATNATGCCAATQSANFDFCSDGTLKATCFDGNAKTATGTSAYNCYCLDFYAGSADRQIVLSDACTSSATATVAALGRSTNCKLTFNPATGEMCRNNSCMRGYGLQLPSANGGTMYALIDVDSANYNVIEGQIYANAFSIAKTCSGEYLYRFSNENYGCPAVGHINNTTTCFWFRYAARIAPQFFAKNPIRLVCTTTTAPSGITFCNSISEAAIATNSTCFGGCTYAQACADIAGSVETTEFTCINDVNSGSQDILMTSATGPLGIVNASTATNACPLKFNPATGVLTTCSVGAKSFKPTCYNWSQSITGIKLDGTTLCMCLA